MKKLKVLIPLIPSILSGIASLPTIVSCKDTLSGPIFDITSDGVLTGFNSKWSKEDIAKKLEGTTTLAIPSNVKRIASKAFYAPNTSLHFETHTTIPSYIEELDLSAATQLNRIESEAFECAPFRTIKFNKSNIYVEDGAFVHNINLSCIDLSDFDTFPFATWSTNAWDLWHAEKGFIQIKNASTAEAWQTYFSAHSCFIFDTNHWSLDISTFDKIFTFDRGTITGLTQSFIDANPEEQSKLLYETSTDSSTLLIPTFHNEPITAIADNAFYIKREEHEQEWYESTLKDNVKYLYFLDGGTKLTVGENAFRKAPFTEIHLSSTVYQIKNNAFKELSNLWYIDASSCNSCEKWATVEKGWDGCPSDGEIVVKANVDHYTQIATFLKRYGVPNNWGLTYSHEGAYDISYDTVLDGFYDDLRSEDIIKMMGWDGSQQVTMPINDVTWVKENAFYRGQSTIPSGGGRSITLDFTQPQQTDKWCKYIGSHAFSYALNITNINFHSSLRAINSYAFSMDTGLKSINIPSSLQILDDGAFSGCQSLSQIDMSSFTEFTEKPAGWSTKGVFNFLPDEGKVLLDSSLSQKKDDRDIIAAYLQAASNGIIHDLEEQGGWEWDYV